MRNLMHGLMAVAVALVLGCGAGTDDSTLGTSSQELREGTYLGYDFTADVVPTVTCETGTVTLAGAVYSAGSGTEVEVSWTNGYLGVITEKQMLSIGNSFKRGEYTFAIALPTDGTYDICFTQAGFGGRATKHACLSFTVDCVTDPL